MGAEDFIGARKIGPILKSASLKYRFPGNFDFPFLLSHLNTITHTHSPPKVKYPDTLTLATRVPPTTVSKDRFSQHFIAISHASGKVVAEGECVVVTFDYQNQKKADIPEEILRVFEREDGGRV
ncbi:hypothetical protein HK097_010789 [Rhizophlyctis rosea]|uniref:Thioesterase domain-containing protein n=1 Tax=Rhizophlyctis rosea TaxID=64517 RepID=A0AAD5X3I3_9FUNG|nr:hypothetical protein HK097_010789 [Rhizophlyctis rosea]